MEIDRRVYHVFYLDLPDSTMYYSDYEISFISLNVWIANLNKLLVIVINSIYKYVYINPTLFDWL